MRPEGADSLPATARKTPEPSPFAPATAGKPGDPSTSRLTASPFVRPWAPSPMPPVPPAHPNARRIAAPAVRQRILAVLKGKAQHADVMDAMQKVYVRLLLLVEELPEDDDALIALVTVVAQGKLVDQKRRATVDEARHVDADDEAVVQLPAEAISAFKTTEWKKMLSFVEKLVDRGEVEPSFLRIARRLAAGETYEEIAPDEGISAPALRKRMERERKRLIARWTAYTGLAGAALGLFLFIFLRKPKPEETALPLPPYTAAPPSTAVAVESPEQQAAVIRARAQTLCDAKKWMECMMALDNAKDLDRDGEYRPEVVHMRRAIQKQYLDHIVK